MMSDPGGVAMVRCLLCTSDIAERDLGNHMREEHEVGRMFWSTTLVRCMFCLAEVAEVDMEEHVRRSHKISGLEFLFDQPKTTTQGIQTDGDEDRYSKK